jgi:hypothetical protein
MAQLQWFCLSESLSYSVAYNSGSDDSVAAAAATVKVITPSLCDYARLCTFHEPQ